MQIAEKPLRAVFVNWAPPDAKHVSGQRCANFAQAMARRGHKIVMLTSANQEGAQGQPDETCAQLAQHNWMEPFHISVSAPSRSVSHWRGPLRKVQSAIRLLHDGHLPQWPRGAADFFDVIASQFQPQVIWALFGSVSDLVVGQRLATASRCPWVMDFKDNFGKFIPNPLGRAIAYRFSDAAAATCNSHFHGAIARKYFLKLDPQLVYSGVAPEMMASPSVVADTKRFVITVIGGIYSLERFKECLVGLNNWLAMLKEPERQRVEIHYAGSDHLKVGSLAHRLNCQLIVHSYLPIQQLAELTRSASINTYMWSENTFHHKLLELLATGRPLISFGGEHPESVNLAKFIGGVLNPCKERQDLVAALNVAWQTWLVNPENCSRFDQQALSWDRFSRELESALVRFARD